MTGNPVKGDYQAHERFAIKLCKSCKRFMFRQFLQTNIMDEFNDMPTENNNIKIQLLLDRYRDFKHGWLESVHEPSKMVALDNNLWI